MQAAAQKWVDSSISKTINVPADIGFEAFKDVYLEAYETGCKGCTTYRPNDVTGSVLSVETDRTRAPSPFIFPKIRRGRRRRRRGRSPLRHRATDSDVIYMSEPLDRPGSLEGHTYKLKWPDSDHALYITINDIMLHGHRRPFEIFINSKNMEHFAWTVALTRMISAVFRRGGDVSFVVEELKAVFDPRGGAWMNGQIRALDPRGHRRRDRAAPDLHRVHRRRGDGAQDRPAGGGREPRRPADRPARPAGNTTCA
jgi:ribonucleoside-diphosphate reductase alpha chain